jgi:hypothetical protein
MAEMQYGVIDGTNLLAQSRTASRPLCDQSSEEEFE